MRRAWSVSVYVITLWAAIVTIVLGWDQWTSHAGADVKVALALLAAFAGSLLLAVAYQEYHYSRKARYAEVLSYLNKVFSRIQALAVTGDATQRQIEGDCKLIVNELASALSLITATKCSVCIKVIEGDPSAPPHATVRPKVVTLCRDSLSEQRERKASNINHWIDRNTDFDQLHKVAGTPREYFFSNHLPSLMGYNNTSFEVYGTPWDVGLPVVSYLLRDLNWNLPYKSTIVYPISPREVSGPEANALTGYLCVDSRSRGAFRKNYDLDILAGAADCLYIVVRRYCELVSAARATVSLPNPQITGTDGERR